MKHTRPLLLGAAVTLAGFGAVAATSSPVSAWPIDVCWQGQTYGSSLEAWADFLAAHPGATQGACQETPPPATDAPPATNAPPPSTDAPPATDAPPPSSAVVVPPATDAPPPEDTTPAPTDDTAPPSGEVVTPPAGEAPPAEEVPAETAPERKVTTTTTAAPAPAPAPAPAEESLPATGFNWHLLALIAGPLTVLGVWFRRLNTKRL